MTSAGVACPERHVGPMFDTSALIGHPQIGPSVITLFESSPSAAPGTTLRIPADILLDRPSKYDNDPGNGGIHGGGHDGGGDGWGGGGEGGDDKFYIVNETFVKTTLFAAMAGGIGGAAVFHMTHSPPEQPDIRNPDTINIQSADLLHASSYDAVPLVSAKFDAKNHNTGTPPNSNLRESHTKHETQALIAQGQYDNDFALSIEGGLFAGIFVAGVLVTSIRYWRHRRKHSQ